MYTWKPRVFFRYLFGILFLLVIIATTRHSVIGQETNRDWSPQERILSHYYDSFAPQLVSDKNGIVHSFHYTDLAMDVEGIDTSEKSAQTAIYYRQWTPDSGWTDPIDIILPPPRAPEFSLQGVVLDFTGIFHLTFYAGDQFNAAIYYSKAPALFAHRASAWSEPEVIGEKAGPIASGTLVGDEMGGLIALYGGKVQVPGLFEIHSTDGGDTWSTPVSVHPEYRAEYFPLAIEATLDEQGRLLAVWSMYGSRSVSSEEVYFARLEADHLTWSEPFQLAKKDEKDYEADWPSVVAYHDELIVFYNDDKPTTRWMRRSEDGGKTWSEPYRPFPQLVGENGAAVFNIDSSDNLHVLMGNRTSGGAEGIRHGMWHSIWLGDQWSSVEAIVSGPQTPEFDPTAPHAAISQGNVLLATWSKDTTAGPRNGAWYSFTTLAAPELPVAPLPTLATASIPIQTLTSLSATRVSTPTREAVSLSQTIDFASGRSQSNATSSLIPSLLFVAALLGVVVVLHRLKIDFRR